MPSKSGFQASPSPGSFAVNPSLFADLPYRLDQFAPITQIANVENVLVISAKLPVKTVAELIARWAPVVDDVLPLSDATAAYERLDGPAGVRLRSSTVQILAMGIHELATNAAKYGALSSPDGSLEVAWLEEGDEVRLSWTEAGGPALAGEPGRLGFGSELARRCVEGQLAGSIARHWLPHGLRVELKLPRARLAA